MDTIGGNDRARKVLYARTYVIGLIFRSPLPAGSVERASHWQVNSPPSRWPAAVVCGVCGAPLHHSSRHAPLILGHFNNTHLTCTNVDPGMNPHSIILMSRMHLLTCTRALVYAKHTRRHGSHVHPISLMQYYVTVFVE